MNRHNSGIEIVADGLHMPECPRWHDEHLWFSDIRGDAVHRIDEGNEEWISPRHLPAVAGASWSRDVTYFTFLPEFVPVGLLGALSRLERALERSRARSWSAHYCARLVKDAVPAAADHVGGRV